MLVLEGTRRNARRSIIAYAALAATLLACGEASDAVPDAGARTAATRGDDRVGGRVVSTVDGHAITVGDVAAAARGAGISPHDALRRLQEESVLANLAERATDGADPEVANATRRAAVQALLEGEIEGRVTLADVTEEEAAARLERDRARFQRAETRSATHVLAQIPADAPPEAVAAAERFARRALETIAASSDPVAAAHAFQDQNAPGRSFQIRVEDLPPFPRLGPIASEFAEPVFAQATAGVLPAVARSSFGFHAIVVTAIVPPWEAPRDEALATVRDELLDEKRAQLLAARLEDLRARTPIERDDDALRRALEALAARDAAGGMR